MIHLTAPSFRHIRPAAVALLLCAPVAMFGQAIQATGNNVNLSGYLKFPSTYGDGNDGKLGNSMFAPGINLVGINNDNTYRKINLWGEITQQQNDGTNQWGGSNRFTGNVYLPFVYDYNNNNYYMDFNGTSRINVLNLDRLVNYSGTTANSGIANGTSSLGSAEFQGNGTGAAMIAFHRPAAYAAYFGIDTDNRWKVGGWSMGNNAYPLLMMNTWNSNIFIHDDGRIYSAILYDTNDTTYYVDPNGTSNLASARVAYNLFVSTANGTGYGIKLADDGDIVDLNDGYASMRFTYGVRIFSANSGGSPVITLGNNGVVSATTFRSSSSERWKEAIRPLEGALDLVRQLNGVRWRWKEGTAQAGQDDVGLVAEAVNKVIPEIVGHDTDGRPNSIDYSRVSSVLVEALKEVDAVNVKNAAELNLLKSELRAMRDASVTQTRTQASYLVLVGAALCIGLLVGRRTVRKQAA